LWYEWARTSRHQFPADPLNNYADVGLPNFSEMFWNNSFQPYGELEFHPVKKLAVTAGTKFAYFKIDTKQLPDNGKTIGDLCQDPTATPAIGSCPAGDQLAFVSNHGSYTAWLPSIDANYRILNNWSAYGQLSTGSIVPPSSVFDYNQTVSPTNLTPSIGTAPKQQRSTTYQFGTVAKLKRVTLDMDFYHVKFQNSYTQSTVLDPVVFYLQPGSITKGFEAESNIYLIKGLSAYLNASVGNAYYHGNIAVSCNTKLTGCTSSTPQIVVSAPSGLWVATTPTDTEAEGLTYQNKGFDVGMFNKRVGSLRQDNGSYHNQGIVNPFSVTNMFLNYTIRAGSRFDQTKIRLSINNLFEEHNLTSLGLKGTAATQTISANGASYTDPFNTTGPTPVSGLDQLALLPGRTITLSVTFGLTPKR
jgi:iron complex outermembrane receptor protein